MSSEDMLALPEVLDQNKNLQQPDEQLSMRARLERATPSGRERIIQEFAAECEEG